MRIIEQYTQSKFTTVPSEDGIVVTEFYAAVTDGATPKSAYKYASDETPGHVASRILTDCIMHLSPQADIIETARSLTRSLQPYTNGIPPQNSPIASAVIYSAARHEIWQIGDCPFATVSHDGTLCEYRNEKEIDKVLASWRAAVNNSLLSRGMVKTADLMTHDNGRVIIQPFITRQLTYQNHPSHRFAYAAVDGRTIPPASLLRCYPIPVGTKEIILASDGFPQLFATLTQTLNHLTHLIHIDPLCTTLLCATKGMTAGANLPDDASYLRLDIGS